MNESKYVYYIYGGRFMIVYCIHANPFHSRSSNALIGDSENDKGHLIYISIAYRHNCYVYMQLRIYSLIIDEI